ncbi:acylphosphatase [Methanofollis aquaemaris]|uniref:acylphosphatase n=1 Tax=Methanofollis aquaemaris TaxID=126734 RepID=A0A8A3S7L0_9EURY|nr:acylphosphatase [Methanofollis aquaemaris]QSZ68022.1 acylphosphatase [Methanofollis aquaemaris]
MKTVRILVSGKVQHVGFRACTRKIAVNLGVCGEVVNCNDGTVEITATGDPAVLEKFVAMVYECPRAVIKEIETEPLETRLYADFTVGREAVQ